MLEEWCRLQLVVVVHTRVSLWVVVPGWELELDVTWVSCREVSGCIGRLRMGGLLTHALGLDHTQTRPKAGCTHRSY